MEHLDAAKKAFDEIRRFADTNEAVIETESDARFQLIDRILVDVLGWRREGFKTEPPTGSGYIDYLLTAGGRNMFVVEAKKLGKVLVTTKLSGLRYFKTGGAALKDALGGIEQAARYASAKSVGFAALTTGQTWVGFRPNRLDGVEYKDGEAAVFPDMAAIEKDFASFYDLFSQEGVTQKLFNIYLDREEGTALSAVDPLVSLIAGSEIYLMKKTDLARDLDQLFNEFFKTLTGDTDEELLLHCFVESAESREADRSLEKITRDLISHVQTIRSDTGIELRKEIEASYETKKGQMVVIVGNKGAGKSTFVERFFKLTLNKSLRDKCLVVKVDLALASGSLNGLQEWITEELIKAAENSLYAGKNPVYDELLGIFFDHYQRWSTGEHKHLHDTDIDAFKIKFGEFIANRRREKPNEYLTSILKRAIRQRSVVPCLVFDNADNFPVQFQDAVFQYAYALFRAVPLSVVVVPITDRTIWRLSKAGALQSYSAKTLYLPVPSTKSVLEKRVMFIRRKLDEGPDKSGLYFSSRGLRIKMENMPAFAACVEEAFINTDYIGRRIAALSNHDLRRSLDLSQKIITAPILKVDELVTAYFSKRDVRIPEMRIVQALIYGEYNKFRQDAHEYVLNMFSVETECMNSPLLRLSILRLLLDKENASQEDLGGYISFEEIAHYFENMGVHVRAILRAIEELLAYRLAEPYAPNEAQVTPTTRLAITASGRMHFDMAFNDPVYLEQMAQTTGLRSERILDDLRKVLAQRMGGAEWAKIKSIFVKYCLDEDARLMSCPSHMDYESQIRLRAELRRWV
jgi:energy-coupling factor transporter ATP-binding protein EcfA2